MSSAVRTARRQVAGLVVGTLGYVFCMLSMGLAEWRMWYMERTPLSPAGLACVGMWKVCIYRHSSYPNRGNACHLYRYTDAYLPLDIRAAQNLLLAASILGLLGKGLLVLGLRRVFVGSLEADVAAQKLFFTAGILKITAGTCISVAVAYNYCSVIKAAGIAFPPSFALPFKPEAQNVGSTCGVAVLAALMMLLSGMLSFFYKGASQNQVHPVLPEM